MASPRVPPAAGIILCLALSVVSVLLCLDAAPPPLGLEEALGAVERARGGGPAPAILVNPRREEIVWHAGGLVRLQAPGAPPPEGTWVGLAHEPGALPSPPAGGEAGELEVVEPWAARRYGPPGGAGVELLALMERMEVRVADRQSNEERLCGTFQGGRWLCGPQGWNYVGPVELVVEGVRQRCLWLHPHEQGEVRVRLGGVAAGSHLSGHFALSDEAAATADGAPVSVAVLVDGAPALERTHPNRRGAVAFHVEIPQGEAERTLEIRVDAARTGRRHFCLQAQLSPPEVRP